MSRRDQDLRGEALRDWIGHVPRHDPDACGDSSSRLCRACSTALQNKIAGKRVDGAPFQVGDRVCVIKLGDFAADRRFLDRCGRVTGLHYTGGCAESFPSDPMIQCEFRRGHASYWAEELATAPAPGPGTEQRWALVRSWLSLAAIGWSGLRAGAGATP